MLPTKNSKKLFFILSLFLVFSDFLFVWLNYKSDLANLKKVLTNHAREYQSLFNVTLDSAVQDMNRLASFIAQDAQIQKLFNQGSLAIKEKDEVQASKIRKKLYQELLPGWKLLNERFDVQQLQFFMAPDLVSFLRMNRPEKFGDKLAEIRHTIFDAHQKQQATGGLETGRITSAIRSVVPINIKIDDEEIYIGLLELGVSFQHVLDLLDEIADAHFSIFISKSHLKNLMWKNFYQDYLAKSLEIKDFLLSSTTSQEILGILKEESIYSVTQQKGMYIIHLPKTEYFFYSFSLRDYEGNLNKNLPPVGFVIVWKDIHSEITLVNQKLRVNLIYALFGLIVFEIILIFLIRAVTSKLEKEVEKKTRLLKKVAITDNLTGLYNRHYLNQYFPEKYAKAQEEKFVISFALLDIDHFKKINDEYGHLKGDAVLSDLSQKITQRVRKDIDQVFRFGGEELLILFFKTPLTGAITVCEELRKKIEDDEIGELPLGKVTLSIGITTTSLHKKESFEEILHRADLALYQAKEKGRNRVEIKEIEDHN